MRIEKLNENKIRIFLNLEDLREKNIDLHTFMSNSIESQDLFLDMLNKAEAEIGFNTQNHKLMIEALASADGCFILTITKIKSDKMSTVKSGMPKIKRQAVIPNKILSIARFNTFDDFCEFCNYFSNSKLGTYIDTFKKSSLILFNNKYYLILNNLKLKMPDLKKFSCIVSEFATPVKNEILLERKLREYGKFIIPRDAIYTCLKYFSA